MKPFLYEARVILEIGESIKIDGGNYKARQHIKYIDAEEARPKKWYFEMKQYNQQYSYCSKTLDSCVVVGTHNCNMECFKLSSLSFGRSFPEGY